MVETEVQYGNTPYGKLYRPKGGLVQFGTFVVAFVGGPLLGTLTGTLLGGLSESAQTVLFIPFVAIFFLGYGLWVSRLNMLGFNLLGRGLLKTVFHLLVFRRAPDSLEEVMPNPEKLVQAAVKAQKAGWSFLLMAIPVALLAMVAAMIMDANTGLGGRVGLVGGGCLLWGYILGWLARRAYLPFMESE